MSPGCQTVSMSLCHFSPGSGSCSLCAQGEPGTIEHILVLCVSLEEKRRQLLTKLNENTMMSDISKDIVQQVINTGNTQEIVQFLLDCSNHPRVISAVQDLGSGLLEELFRFTRSWCYSVHKARLKLLGRWIKD